MYDYDEYTLSFYLKNIQTNCYEVPDNVNSHYMQESSYIEICCKVLTIVIHITCI